MKTCCADLGNGTVFVQDDCFAWCDVESPDVRRFSDCLVSGTNSTGVRDVGCSLDSYYNNYSDDKSSGTPAYTTPEGHPFGAFLWSPRAELTVHISHTGLRTWKAERIGIVVVSFDIYR